MTRMTGPDCVVMCNLIITYIHTYIHKYTYINIHTYINKYIHTYIPNASSPLLSVSLSVYQGVQKQLSAKSKGAQTAARVLTATSSVRMRSARRFNGEIIGDAKPSALERVRCLMCDVCDVRFL